MYEEAKAKGKEGCYYFWKTDIMMTREEMVGFWDEMATKYPIISLVNPQLGKYFQEHDPNHLFAYKWIVLLFKFPLKYLS